MDRIHKIRKMKLAFVYQDVIVFASRTIYLLCIHEMCVVFCGKL